MGIEAGTDAFLTDVAAEAAPGAPIAVLSGPSFRGGCRPRVADRRDMASRDGALAARLAAALSGPTFRVYHGSDPRGVEIGGAARTCSPSPAGLGDRPGPRGESARAALVARSFAELMRFARAWTPPQ